HFFQFVPEVKNLLRSFLLPQGIQGIAEEARRCAVGMELVHKVIVGIQIAVDDRHTVGGASHHIQPPVGVRVLVGFHFVAKVALQIGFRIGGKFQAPLLQRVRKLGHKNGRLCLGLLQYIEAVYVSHVGDLAQHLVSEGGEHPPDPAFLLPEHGQQLFAVGGDGEAVFALF
ncbi:Tetratricopeptide repeat protein, partial [Dysosmobacter welbionis]